jgi:hypothetical protein
VSALVDDADGLRALAARYGSARVKSYAERAIAGDVRAFSRLVEALAACSLDATRSRSEAGRKKGN